MKRTKLKNTEEFSTKEFNVYFPFSTKDISETANSIEGKVIKIQGWANFSGDLSDEKAVFVDHSGDVMVPSGFDLSVWNSNPQILWQHDRSYSIGKGLKATKKKEGLEITAEVHEKAMQDEDFYRVEQGLVTMLSVGFKTVEGEFKEINGKDVFYITKALLYEVSLVTIPCNAASGFSVVKSMADGSIHAEGMNLSPESSSAEVVTNKTVSEDHVKLKLRDLMTEDKVKEIEDLGLGSTLDELRDVDTKSYVQSLVVKEVQVEIAKALEAFKAEQTKSAEAPAEEVKEEELPASEETPAVEEEAIVEETEEEKAAHAEFDKTLSDFQATLKALVEEK